MTVEVRTLSGKIIATLAFDSPEETVGAFRHRLLKGAPDSFDIGSSYGHSWLIHGCSVLPDHRPLGECLSSQKMQDSSYPSSESELISVTLVVARPSSLGVHIAQAGLDEAGGLVDVADAVFQAEHTAAMRHRPRAEDAAHNLSPDLRSQVVNWFAIACSSVGLDEQILHGAVLTLDRFCAVQRSPLDEARLLRICLAVLSTEMKLAPSDELPSGTWQRLVLHLGQGRESLPDIFRCEGELLRQLGFNVWVPTPMTFLRGLGLRLCHGSSQPRLEGDKADGPAPASAEAALQLSFAQFFVDMALSDVFLQYRFPAAVLAAAALGAAQFATGSWSRKVHETLLEDLASYCPDLPEARGLAEECERLVLEMWRDCSSGTSRWADCYGPLCARHSVPRRDPMNQDAIRSRFGDYLQEASPETALNSWHQSKEC